METNKAKDVGDTPLRPSFCQFCGKAIPEEAEFCPSCGSQIDARGNDGLSLAAIILGIIGLVFCWVPVFGFIVSAVGVGLAIPAANKQQKRYELALILTLLGAFFGLIFLFVEPML